MSHCCVSFDGSAQSSLTVANPPSVQMAGDLTIELWSKPTATPAGTLANGVSVIHKNIAGEGALLLDSSLKLRFLFGDGVSITAPLAVSSTSIPLATFTHVAVVRDMLAKTIRFYIGGQLAGSTSFALDRIQPGTGALVIGSGSTAGFRGELAEVRLWSKVRTPPQIELNRERRLDGNEAGLIGYFPLDEGAGTQAEDDSPQRNTGALGSAATWVGLGLDSLRPYQAMATAGLRPLVKQYGDRHYIYTAMVRHAGTVVGFAMDDERRIFYSVLDLASTDEARGELDMQYWSDTPRAVPFGREVSEVGFAIVDNVTMPTIQSGASDEDQTGKLALDEIDVFRSSTARLSASAPFQVLSDGAHIYLFRQSIDGGHADALFIRKDGGASALGQRPDGDFVLDGAKKVPLVDSVLLVDRFLLVGGALQTVLEPRYQRSRHKVRPASTKDTLGVQDMDGVPFCEPTQILSLVRQLTQGRFAVQVLPTQVADCRRWQIFAHNGLTQRIDSFNIERTSDGLFNTQGSRFYTSPDPAYRQAVFERAPGKCPFTGQALIPLVPPSLFAESALSFDGANDYVELGTPAALSFTERTYTIAAWVRFSKNGGALFAKGLSGTTSGFEISLSSQNKIVVTHRGSTVTSVVATTSVTLNSFVHVAVTYDKTSVRIYLNGLAAGAASASFTPGTGSVTIGTGNPAGSVFFGGTLDELRIYRRALGADEINDSRSYRLVGKEPGLAAYYRFDEGQGTTLFDQTDSAAHGTLRSGGTWVTSSAPVADHPGVRRDSFLVAARQLAGGLSAQLYFAQNGSPDQPHKGQARLLLAFPTSGPDASGSPTASQYIATLDLAIGVDGRLASVPDVVQLPFIGANNVSAQLDQVAAIELAITRLKEEIDALTAGGASATELVPYTAALTAKTSELANLSPGVPSDEVRHAVPQLACDPLGLSVFGAILGFAYASDAPFLFDSARGEVVLYFRGQNGRFFAAYYDTRRARGALALPVGSDLLRLTPRSDGADLGRLSLSVAASGSGNAATCTVSISDTSLASVRTETFGEVPRAVPLFAAVLNGTLPEPVFLGTQLAAAAATTTLSLAAPCQQSLPAGSLVRVGSTMATLAAAATAGDLTLTLTTPLASVAAGTVIEGAAYNYGLASCNLPGASLAAGSLLLACDAGSLSVAIPDGSSAMLSPSLGPAWHSDAPGRAFVFDSSTTALSLSDASRLAATETPGDLTLEAWLQPADVTTQRRVLYQRTSPTRRYTLGVSGARDPQKDVLQVESDAFVDLGNPNLGTAGFTIELWIARLQGGQAQTVLQLVGAALSLDFDAQDYLQLRVGADPVLSLSVPTVDRDFHHLAVTYSAARRERQIYRDGVLLASNTLTQAFVLPSGTIRLSGPLRADELRFYNRVLSAEEIATSLPSPRIGNEAGLVACFAVEEGELRDRGPSGLAASVLGKSSIERVGVLPGDPLLLRAATGGSDLKLETVNPLPFPLNDKDFTIELWARRQRLNVNEWFIEHGTAPAMANSMLQLGFVGNKLRFSFYGDTALDSDIAFNDLDWHHLAFTYSRSSGLRRIYRDGVMVAEKVYATGYAGTGKLRIGYTSSVTAQVDLAEVRIWDRAREQAEILADHRQKLGGSEPGLLALFSCVDVNFTDLGPSKCAIFSWALVTVSVLGGQLTMPGGPCVPLPLPVLPDRPDPALAAPLSGQVLDGVDDSFDFGSDIVLNDKDWSIEMWMRRPLGQSALVLLHGNPGFASNNTLSFGYVSGTQILLGFMDNDLLVNNVSGDCEWHHLAATYQRSTRTRRVYVDGVERGSSTTSTPYQGTGPLVIGCRGGTYIRAEVAELRIFSRVRTQLEIAADMTRALTGSEDALLLLLQQVGGQLADVGPRRIPATVKGAPRREPVAVVPTELPLPEGAPLSALRLSAVDPKQYVDAGSQLVLSDKSFTVEFWARRRRLGSWDLFVTQGGEVAISTNKVLHIGFTPSNQLRFGFGGNDLDSDVYSDQEWHHYAFTYNRGTAARCIYRDGVLVKSAPASAAYAGSGRLCLGAWTNLGYYAEVDLAELRIWNGELNAAAVRQNALRLLSGQEPGLIAYFAARGPKLRDCSSSKLPCAVSGTPTYVQLPFSLAPTGTQPPPWNRYQVLAGCGTSYARSTDLFPPYKWSHFAVSYRQSWAVKLAGSAYLDAGKRDSTNLCGDLTIEAFLQLADTSVEQGVLARGRLADGSGGSVPYHLNIEAGGALVFRFEDDAGKERCYRSKSRLQKGRFYRVAVLRKSSTTATSKSSASCDICIYVDGSLWLNEHYEGQSPTGHKGALELGRTFVGSKPKYLRGILSEVRLWSEARPIARLGTRPRPGESGLVALWRFEENAGTVAKDSVGESDARLCGAEWTQSPDPQASELRFFANGMPAAMAAIADPDVGGPSGFALGGIPGPGLGSEIYRGAMEEVRIFRCVRSEEQILDNLFTRLKGDRQDLIAYYTFDADSTRPDSLWVNDSGLRGVGLALPAVGASSRPRIVLSTAPISNDASIIRSAIASVGSSFHERLDRTPAVGEYADLQRDEYGGVSGVMKRCYGLLQGQRWHLITGYKVGTLLTEWVGQAQFAPQLMGYIEGAPPLPSENLTPQALDDIEVHKGPSKVRFIQSEEVVQSVSASREQSVNGGFRLAFNNAYNAELWSVTAPMGLGIAFPAAQASAAKELSFNLEMEGAWSSDVEASYGHGSEHGMSAVASGYWEDKTKVYNPALGQSAGFPITAALHWCSHRSPMCLPCAFPTTRPWLHTASSPTPTSRAT